MSTKKDIASYAAGLTVNGKDSQLTTATPLAWLGVFSAPGVTVTSWATCETNLKPWKEQRSISDNPLLYQC